MLELADTLRNIYIYISLGTLTFHPKLPLDISTPVTGDADPFRVGNDSMRALEAEELNLGSKLAVNSWQAPQWIKVLASEKTRLLKMSSKSTIHNVGAC
jgi:hypothetical protein